MAETRIAKPRPTVPPILDNYEAARRAFTWQTASRALAGLPGGRGLNMAHEAVDRHAAGTRRDAVALRWIDAHNRAHEYTYSELCQLSNRFANVLQTLAVGPGDHVFSLLERVPELHVTVLGTLKNRSVFCPLFAGYGPETLSTRLARGRARVLVTSPVLYERKVRGIRQALPHLEHVILVGERANDVDASTYSWSRLVAASREHFDIPKTDPSDPALLHFTSGTTGAPKGALHAHRAVIAQHATAQLALDLRPEDVFWCTADPGWVTATVYGVIAPLTVGATIVLDEAPFDAGRWCTLLADQRISVWYTTPTAVRLLQRLGQPAQPSSAFRELRFMATVGEPLDATSVRWGVEAFGRPFHDTWWQTETGAIMIANYACEDIDAGSMGRPAPGVEAAIVRRVGRRGLEYLETPEQCGELALQAGWPSMFTGYLDAPQRYEACFRDGWYLTGDLARRDAAGRYWFIGRADDMIKSSGHLVGPFEVEGVLREHPAVAEAAVIGKPDPVAHEVVKAIVSLKKGVKATDALRLEIMAHARRRLGAAVAPKEIAFCQDLPKTESGKVVRRTLRAAEMSSRAPE